MNDSGGSSRKYSSGVLKPIPILAAKSLYSGQSKGKLTPLRGKVSISTIWPFMSLSNFECGELTDPSRHGPFVACLSLLVQQHHRHKRIASSQLILRARDRGLLTFPATC